MEDEIRAPDQLYEDTLTGSDTVLAYINLEEDVELRNVLLQSYHENKAQKNYDDKIRHLMNESSIRDMKSKYNNKKESEYVKLRLEEEQAKIQLEIDLRKNKVEKILVWIIRTKNYSSELDKERLSKIHEEFSNFIIGEVFIKLTSLRFLKSKGINIKLFDIIENDIYDDENEIEDDESLDSEYEYEED